MLKNKTKFVVVLLAFLLLISTLSFATDTAVTTSAEGDVVANVTTDTTTAEPEATTEGADASATEEIYNGDLYVFENDIEMNQLVDGNVYLFGNNINVTGKVNGCLYVIGNNVTFSKDAYVVQAVYAMADQITFDGCSTDLYASAKKIDMSYDSFVLRDLRVIADTFNFNGGAGRDAFIEAKNFNFIKGEGEEAKSAIVYGNLTYSSPNELTLDESLVQGTVNYSKDSLITNNTNTMLNSASVMRTALQIGNVLIVLIVLSVIGVLALLALVVFLVVRFVKSLPKTEKNESTETVKAEKPKKEKVKKEKIEKAKKEKKSKKDDENK